ncbi:hypothetical protein WDW37_17525 [Bdellovibrionota bacterium FG-1]
MEEQGEKVLQPNVDQELEGIVRRERKRTVDSESEPGIVRVRLPVAVGARVREVVSVLRERGAQVSLDELLAGYFESIPESYFEEQLISRTPEQYYLEAAARVPELREILIRHAKKGLLRGTAPKSTGISTKSAGRRRKDSGPTPSDLGQGTGSQVAGD